MKKNIQIISYSKTYLIGLVLLFLFFVNNAFAQNEDLALHFIAPESVTAATFVACNAGTVAPSFENYSSGGVSYYSKVNSSFYIPCGSTTANLNVLLASNQPAIASVILTWHTATTPTAANKIPNASMPNLAAVTGTTKYYAAFFDTINNCYSPTKEIIVYAPICAAADDYTTTPIIYGEGGTLPTVFGNDTYNGVLISTLPANSVSTIYSWWVPSNGDLNFSNGVITVPATTLPGVYTYYYEIRDIDPDAVTNSNFTVAVVTFRVVSCTNMPAGGQPDYYTKTGVSSLEGFIGGTNGWPGNIPNGFIAIESKNKGFVITRIQNVSLIPVSERVEGMLVYDIDAKCVKLYNGTNWNCLSKDCILPTK